MKIVYTVVYKDIDGSQCFTQGFLRIENKSLDKDPHVHVHRAGGGYLPIKARSIIKVA